MTVKLHTGRLAAASVLIAATMAAAPSAHAEPTSWNIWCRDIYGSVYYVSNPASCTQGYVKFINTRTGKVDLTASIATLYNYTVPKQTFQTWSQANAACAKYVWCGVIAGIGTTFIAGKLKLAWSTFRALV